MKLHRLQQTHYLWHPQSLSRSDIDRRERDATGVRSDMSAMTQYGRSDAYGRLATNVKG